ncbi:MAG: hypothetical protein E6I88_04920 [Chloroflexi bacterium]|nr:MAG: hypothetical protein E6I88_04920 [Chloroflexota bacterium]
MNRVLTIARLTVLEASRRKLLLALALLTLAVIVLTSWGFSRLPTMKDVTPAQVRLAASQLTILVAFMFSGVLALGSTLVAAPAIASDIESGIALAILPRPIRRSQVLMGKWLGLAVLVVLSPMTGGVIALVLFFVAWIGGIALAIGQVFGNDTIINIGVGSRLLIPTDGLWHGAIFYLEPSDILAAARVAGRARAGNPFFADQPLAFKYILWVIAWLVAVLGLANWSFARRDL